MTSRERARQGAERVLQGQAAAVARAITWIENGAAEAEHVLSYLARHLGRAHRIGITGPPGAGKSTLVDALACEVRRRQQSVGVVAVDPSSPFSGGALLGDRVRMTSALQDPGVFVRSMASRGCMGGLARTVQEVADVLDASAKDCIFLETVGVGQSELAVAQSCDTCVVVLVPEAGGVVQAMKAGLMEIAEIFVVNKSDRPAADEMFRQLMEAASFLQKQDWTPPVVKTVALEGQGVAELYDEMLRHRAWLQEGQRLERKRQLQNGARIRELVRAALEEQLWKDELVSAQLDSYAERLGTGQVSVHEAAAQVWQVVLSRLSLVDLGTHPMEKG